MRDMAEYIDKERDDMDGWTQMVVKGCVRTYDDVYTSNLVISYDFESTL